MTEPRHCIHCGQAEPIKVDVFLPTVHNWGLALMIRTGSGIGPSGTAVDGFAPAMLAQWKRVSGGGESRSMMLHDGRGDSVPTPEEEDVFRACKVEWIEPVFRNDGAIVKQRSRA